MWDNVLVGFDGGETANFGPRQEYEGEKSLYEVQTFAVITSSDETPVYESPTIVSSVNSKYISFAANQCLSIFSCENQEILHAINFDHNVKCISWDNQILFSLIGLSNGQVHILYGSSMKIIFSVNLFGDEITENLSLISAAFVSGKNDDLTILVLDSLNRVHMLHGFLINKFLHGFENQDLKAVSEFKSSVKSVKINLSEHVNVQFMEICSSNTSLFQAYGFGKNRNTLCFWKNFEDYSNYESVDLQDVQINKVFSSFDGKYIFILDNDGLFAIVCQKTLQILKIFEDFEVCDFRLLETLEDEKVVNCEVAMIVRENNSEDSSKFLKLLSFPDFKLLYSLLISPLSYLISSEYNHDELFLVEGNFNEDDNSEIDSLRIRTISELSPDCRLINLLHKRKFDEAEKCAQLFRLDPQPIYKSRIAFIFEHLSHWKINDLSEEEFNNMREEFMKYIKIIQDIDFIVESCIKICLKSIDDNKAIINYAQSVLEVETNKIIDNNKAASHLMKLTAKVNNMLQRLETFDQAFGQSQFCKLWCHFSTCCLKTEMMTYIRIAEFHVAFTIWERHKGTFINKDSGIIIQLLLQLSKICPNEVLVPWFKDSLLPCIIQICPNCLETVAGWMIDKAKDMELTDKINWPMNAESFLEIFPRVCGEQTTTTYNSNNLDFASQLVMLEVQEKAVASESSISLLLRMINNLKELLVLWKTFNCRLPLVEFCQDDKLNVIFSILDVLPKVEDIPNLIANFLVTFSKKYCLIIDDVLQCYISNILKSSTYNWWHWEEAPWQEPILLIIDSVKNIDLKFQCTLKVLKQAPIPWSEGITALVNKMYLLDHSSIDQLKQQQKLVGLKAVLLKYGLNHYPVSDQRNANKLMKYILTQNRNTAIPDAMEVINSYEHLTTFELYNFRMKFLISRNMIDDFNTVLRSMPSDILHECCLRLYNYTTIMLENKDFIHIQEVRQEYLRFTYATIIAVNANRNHPRFQAVIQQLDDLKSIHSLQKEFGVFLSLKDLDDRDKVLSILDEVLKSFVENFPLDVDTFDFDRKNESSSKFTYCKLFRFISLIKVSKEEALSQLGKKYLQKDDLVSAVKTCKYLSINDNLSEGTANILLNLVNDICKVYSLQMCSKSNFPSLMNEILQLALTYCKKDSILKCIELIRWTSLIQLLHEQSDNWKSPVNQHALVKDSYENLEISSWHKDVALRVKANDVLPFVFKLLNSCLSENFSGKLDHNILHSMIANVKNLSESLTKYLTSKSQDTFAYTSSIGTLTFLSYAIYDTYATVKSEEKEILINGLSSMLNEQSQVELNLLRKIFRSKMPDHELAIGLLLSMPKRSALSALKMMVAQVGSEYSKQANIACIGTQYAKILELPSEVEDQFCLLQKRATWGEKLSALNISFREAFATNLVTHIAKVTADIVSHPDVEVEFVEEFCSTFDLNLESTLLEYLQACLLSISSDCDQNSIEKCLSKISKIQFDHSCNDQLIELYEYYLGKIDSYNYEVLEFILKKLKSLITSNDNELVKTSEKGLKLLETLKLYKRVSPPGNNEIDHWSKHQPSVTDLPRISEKRLPFHILNSKELWKVISPELNCKTIDNWLVIATKLKISTNQLRVVTVQNIVAEWLKCHPTLNEELSFDMNCVDEHFFQNVRDTIVGISNLEMATACANWMMQRVPKGQNKVEATKIALDFAAEWMKEAKCQRSIDAYSKIQNAYHRLKTIQILYRYELASSDNLNLASKPVKLIFQIFEKNDVSHLISDNQNNIYQASIEIATVNDYNFSKICLNILEKWLPPPEQLPENNQEQTVNFNLLMMNVKEHVDGNNAKQEENIRKAIYLLKQHENDDVKVAYLAQIALSDSSNSSSSQKYQALRCLLSITDDEAIMKMTKRTVPDLRIYMESLLCVSQLEAFNLPYTIDGFEQSDKVELVEGILHSHSHEPLAIEFVYSLCLHYKLYLPPVWDLLLKQMVSLNMMVQLDNILTHLMNIPELCHSSAFINALNKLLLNPFQDACLPLSDEQIRKCFKSLLLILRCPVLKGIDIMKIADQFKSLKMWSAAIACYLRLETLAMRKNLTQTVIEDLTPKEILLDIHRLQTEYHSDVTALSPVKLLIYDFVNENEKFEDIVDTQFFNDIINYLIPEKNIEKVISYLTTTERYEVAVKVINLFNKYHSHNNVIIHNSQESNSQLDFIKEFMEQKQFEFSKLSETVS